MYSAKNYEKWSACLPDDSIIRKSGSVQDGGDECGSEFVDVVYLKNLTKHTGEMTGLIWKRFCVFVSQRSVDDLFSLHRKSSPYYESRRLVRVRSASVTSRQGAAVTLVSEQCQGDEDRYVPFVKAHRLIWMLMVLQGKLPPSEQWYRNGNKKLLILILNSNHNERIMKDPGAGKGKGQARLHMWPPPSPLFTRRQGSSFIWFSMPNVCLSQGLRRPRVTFAGSPRQINGWCRSRSSPVSGRPVHPHCTSGMCKSRYAYNKVEATVTQQEAGWGFGKTWCIFLYQTEWQAPSMKLQKYP